MIPKQQPFTYWKGFPELSFYFNLTSVYPNALSMCFILFYPQKRWEKAISQFDFIIKISPQDSRKRDCCQLQTEVMILLKETLLIISMQMQTP